MSSARSEKEIFYFCPESLGCQIKEVSFETLELEREQLSERRFKASKKAEIVYWIDEYSNIIKQQLSFYGQRIDWDLLKGIRTGLVFEEESDGQVSKKFYYDSKINFWAVEQGIGILKSSVRIPEKDRFFLIQCLEGNLTIKHKELCEKHFEGGKKEAKGWLQKVSDWLSELTK